MLLRYFKHPRSVKHQLGFHFLRRLLPLFLMQSISDPHGANSVTTHVWFGMTHTLKKWTIWSHRNLSSITTSLVNSVIASSLAVTSFTRLTATSFPRNFPRKTTPKLPSDG